MAAQDCPIIHINNRSMSVKQFILFQDVKKPNDMPDEAIFTHVCLNSGQIPSGDYSSIQFALQNEYYAMYRVLDGDRGASARVGTSNAMEARLGPNGLQVVVRKELDGSVTFGPRSMAGRVNGGFTIACDESVRGLNGRQLHVGVGVRGPRNRSINPIATYLAKPGMKVDLCPRLIYYIANGSHAPGTIVERGSLENVLMVNFTNASTLEASFELSPGGVYRDPDGSAERNGITWANVPAGAWTNMGHC